MKAMTGIITIFTFMCILTTLQTSFAQSQRQFNINVTKSPVVALLTGAANLSCQVSTAVSAERMTIKFHRGDPKSYVNVYNKNPADPGTQDEKYKDRTEFVTENITQGQVTLRIKTVQWSDIGNYTCHFISPEYNKAGIVELQVTDTFDVKVYFTNVFVALGKDLDLDFFLVPEMNAKHMTIKFYRGQGDPRSYVHAYNPGRLDDTYTQEEAFKGRTEFWTDKIEKGHVTVRIKNFQQSDTGIYFCQFISDYHNATATVELKKEKFDVDVNKTHVFASLGEDVDLGFYLTPEMNATHMTITCYQGDPRSYVCAYNPGRLDDTYTQEEAFKGRTELLTDQIWKGQVTLRIKKFQSSDTGIYTCQFISDSQNATATLELNVDNSWKTWHIAILVLVCLAAAAAAVAGFVWGFYNRRKLKETVRYYQHKTGQKFDEERETLKEVPAETLEAPEPLKEAVASKKEEALDIILRAVGKSETNEEAVKWQMEAAEKLQKAARDLKTRIKSTTAEDEETSFIL